MSLINRAFAVKADQEDALASFRNRFFIADPKMIYLDGNSLGMLPAHTSACINDVVENEWGTGLIRSWNSHWYTRSQQIAAKLAPIVGARPDEVIIADSTSVNLFKLAFAALQHNKNRKTIVSDELNFPSDLYVLQGLASLMGEGYQLKLVKSANGIDIDQYELEQHIDENTALVSLSHVLFKSAYMYDMAQVTRIAQQKGALVLWDLSHAAGAVLVNLNRCHADLAIGCTYKYLNGGPGSLAYLYVRKDLQAQLQSPIWGWFGQENPFAFDLDYQPAKRIERFLAGTPPVLSLSAIEPALDLLIEAGMDQLRQKSIALSSYLLDLFYKYLQPLGFKLQSPADAGSRGSHISISHPEAYRICRALIHKNTGSRVVIPDFREPDVIRLGIAPLYNSWCDIYDAVSEIKDITQNRWFEKFPQSKETVT